MAQGRGLINPLKLARGTFYGWRLVGVAAMVMALGIVPFFYGMTTWFVALERHFPWNRGQLSLAFSLTRAEGSVTGPVGGYLTDKLGPRRMALIGLLILGGGFLLFSQIRNLWQFYLVFVVISTGSGLGTWLQMMTMLNSWFVRHRSAAMAIAMAASAAVGVLLIPVLAWAIDPDEPDRFGWRVTAAGIGVIIMVLAFPMSRLVRDRPEDFGLRPDGDSATPAPVTTGLTGAAPSGPEERGFTWQEAILTRDFWLMSIGHACCTTVVVTIMVHLGPMLTDRGFSLPMVGWVVSTHIAIGVIFTIVGGYVGDRVPMRVAIFGFATLQSISLVVALLAKTAPVAFLFAVLLGIGQGRGPLTSSIRGLYFGRTAFASIMGISQIPMNIMLFIAPYFAGTMFDATGKYDVPFITIAVVSFLGACLFLFMGAPRPVSSYRRSAQQSRR